MAGARGASTDPDPLGLEQRSSRRGLADARRDRRWAAPARVPVAYPGLWVRPDVYATHGHYLDCHLTIPTLERMSVGAMGRLLGRAAGGLAGADDYEAVSAPMYAWRDAITRYAPTGPMLNGLATVARLARARRRRLGRGRRERSARGGRCSRAARARRCAGGARARFPLAVAALNRAGSAP